MKIFGFTHGAHDSSYSILIDGKITIHEELERINRQKETNQDVIEYYLNKYGQDSLNDFDYIAYYPHGSYNNSLGDFNWFSQKFLDLWLEERRIENGNHGYGTPREHMKNKVVEVGHHAAHAANAFYSSDFDESLIFSIDGGGSDRSPEGNLYWSSFTVWHGKGNKITQLYNENNPSLGIIWTNMLNHVYQLQASGPPNGCQAGTVMGMAAYGDSSKFTDEDTNTILSYDTSKYLSLTVEEKFDLAAKLQQVTENYIVEKITPYIEQYGIKNICFTGGVSLNCAMIGKMKSLLKVDNVHVPPVPYDSGLAMGVTQYVYHQILNNPRSTDISYKTPYLGNEYSKEEIIASLHMRASEVSYIEAHDDAVCNLLDKQQVISIFGGRSESGRRALGNRSIIADPRSPNIKNIINEKIKHRQWFRPFAPSILRDYVEDWFVEDVNSPYMSFSVKFKEDKKELVPAVVHKDGTGRLQTVTKQLNSRYHDLLTTWYKKTGVPILLNTSFNDSEPIVETPMDAINCFLKTKIDYLYFTDCNLLVHKVNNNTEQYKTLIDESMSPENSLHSKQDEMLRNSNIIVAQFYTDNVEYGPTTETINSKYCNLHGYGYFVETNTQKIKNSLEGRAYTWYKPKLILEIFEKYNPEYVLFLDIDAVVVDFQEKIENYISTDHDIIFTEDYGHHSKVNAGVFLIKNTNWSKYLLKRWWDSADIFKGGDCPQLEMPPQSMEEIGYYKNGLWHDQTCMTILYEKNLDVQHMVKIIPNSKLNWRRAFDGNFVFHAFAYGSLPMRTIDFVKTKLFDESTKNLSLKTIASNYTMERDYIHGFLPTYENTLPNRNTTKTVIQLGVHDLGDGLELWNTYFENAKVIGVDTQFNIGGKELTGISLVKLNVENSNDIEKFARKYTDVDLIIDDYTNRMRDQQVLLAKLFKGLISSGIYIIEDLHTSIKCKESSEWGDSSKTLTLDMLQHFKETGIIKSDYMTSEECAYLQTNISACEIYEGYNGHFTAVIKKL